MKHIIITTIAAVLLVGCSGPPPKDIWEATKQGDVDAVKQFIVAGEDVNAKDNNGVSPLHYAAYYGEKEVAELLIAKGADVNAKDVNDETPLNWAEEGKHIEITDLLRKHGGKSGEELKAAGK